MLLDSWIQKDTCCRDTGNMLPATSNMLLVAGNMLLVRATCFWLKIANCNEYYNEYERTEQNGVSHLDLTIMVCFVV